LGIIAQRDELTAKSRRPEANRSKLLFEVYVMQGDMVIGEGLRRRTIIAEPTEETLSKFQEILNKVLSPPELFSKFKEEIRCFSPETKLHEALKYMKEHDFSQT